jgi:hypothetical protein
MNPWVVAGVIGIGGLVVLAGSSASASPGCTIVDEWVIPFGLAAVLMRVCETEGAATLVLWDVAMLEDVEIGEEWAPDTWPDKSLFYGQSDTAVAAIDAAGEWIEANTAWLQAGGTRGPLAQRLEGFLAELTPQELDQLQAIFAFEGTAVSDAWPYVDALRVAATDQAFIEIGEDLGYKLGLLTEAERSQLQTDLLATVGILRGLTLKNLLADAGVT